MTYLLVLVLLLAAELVYFRVAARFNIIDRLNGRSSHTRVTIRGGGIVFLLGAWLHAAFYGLQYPWFLLGLTAIAGVSFIDDIRSVPNPVRLVVQFAAMFLMFHDWGILTPRDWQVIIPGLILCVGIINAYNFMDGINGITGGYSLAVLVPLSCINRSVRFIDEDYLVVAMLSAVVFCFFNFRRKAKCFAGDVGSVVIAFIVVFATGKLILLTGDFTYIILLAVYGVDSVLTIVHRVLLHENLGEAHRKHAYQLLANELKLPHVTVATIYALVQLIISFGLIYLPVYHWIYGGVVLIVLCLAYVLFMKKYYHLHEEYLTGIRK